LKVTLGEGLGQASASPPFHGNWGVHSMKEFIKHEQFSK